MSLRLVSPPISASPRLRVSASPCPTPTTNFSANPIYFSPTPDSPLLIPTGLISCPVEYLHFGEGKAEGRRQKAEGKKRLEGKRFFDH
ncbi:MAG: hypothetical protein F6K39_46605 [Okeania sp. SIO3B3]|nr:hypothetical protein [Okeania sp. SIO3B3]